jgi:Rieske Fe-S protein
MAFTSTWRQNETQGFRGLGALVVCLLLAVVPAVIFLWPREAVTGHVVDTGLLSDLPSRAPVYFGDGNFWLVKLDEKNVLALSATDSHVGHCQVSWRTDFVFDNEAGWFRAYCSGSTFDLSGNRIYGPSPRGLDRYDVRFSNSSGTRVLVIADDGHLTKGRSDRNSTVENATRP